MFAFEIFEKVDFFVILPVLGKFLINLKKNFSRPSFSFFGAFFWLRLLSRTVTSRQYQKSHLPLFWWCKKTHFWKIWKKQFRDFTPKPLPTADCGVHHWIERQKYNQKQKTLKLFEHF